jgi:hypothetical protein
VACTVHLRIWIWIFGRRSGSFLSIDMTAKVALLAFVILVLRWMLTSRDFLTNPRYDDVLWGIITALFMTIGAVSSLL